MNQHELAARFRQLHGQPPIVLPNAWDVVSARVIEHAGARAIATTSAAVSWAAGWRDGRLDGHGVSRRRATEVVQAIVDAVDVPVSADIESGYGSGTVDDVAATVEMILDAGAVGINLEDAPGRGGELLLAPEEQAERIRTARAVAQSKGVDLFINARTDVYLAAVGEPATRLGAVIERAALYLEAGADGVFVPAVVDADRIAALVKGVDAPLNIMVGPGAPTVRELSEIGVARVSLGPAVALAALGAVEQVAHGLLTDGSYRGLENGLSFGEVNQLFEND